MKEVDNSKIFQLQLVVTGGHLLKEQGHTIGQIKEDGFRIDAEVDARMDLATKESIAASMGRMAEGMAHTFTELEPDYVVVLGDRYELLPICNTAFVMNIPIIHLSGGDITEGAIDNGIRNAVTMLASYHFPGTEDSAANICRMIGNDKNVWTVGEPGLDAFHREKLLNRIDLAKALNLEESKDWVLLTYHSETRKSLEYNLSVIKNIIESLIEIPNIFVIATYSNGDCGGRMINNYLEEQGGKIPEKLRVIPSLGTKRYLSVMKQVRFIIGNSSSGITEAPVLGKAVINIGDRQKGRYLCSNVEQCDTDRNAIKHAIDTVMKSPADVSDTHYWGDGHTAEKIMTIFEKVLL
ncbi:MAG: UDP-N-acetylglucosamine 2-epimerase [Clostridium sp.]|nr:UDP-N-acetylglucosamine 2-epimerase [Clostridium sp.]